MRRALLVLLLVLPSFMYFCGAASNQLVIIANHGCMPVQVSSAWLQASGITPDVNGQLDKMHCVMDANSRLKFLADIFNFHSSIESVGDLLLTAADTIRPYFFGAFLLGCFIPFTKRTDESRTPTAHTWGLVAPGRVWGSTTHPCKAPTTSGRYLEDSTR